MQKLFTLYGTRYYAYLPAIFDYKDLSFQSLGENISGVWKNNEGEYINKYPVGTAFLELPFFVIADVFCKSWDATLVTSLGIPPQVISMFFPDKFFLATGYSMPYQISVFVAASFYFIFGLILLYKYLKKYFSEKIAMWTIVTLVFATNLFHYAAYDACFSHIYSFFLITSFIYVIEMFKPSNKKDLLIGFLISMIFITRNPNIIVGLFYFFYKVKDKNSFIQRMKEIFNPKTLSFNILGALLPIILQCSYWYVATGHFFIRSYHSVETFSWFTPHVLDVLFSIRKGMLLWAPALVFAFLGLAIVKKYKKEISFLSYMVVMILAVYIISAWDCWWYGHSFGQRPFVDYYCFFAVMLAVFFDFLNNTKVQYGSNSKISVSVFNVFMKPMLIFMILLSTRFMISYWHMVLSRDEATIENVQKAFLNPRFDHMREKIIDGLS